MLKHDFTAEIISILDKHCSHFGNGIISKNELLQYLNIKTKAANRGSKTRAGYANLYAIYVLLEDYLNGNFEKSNAYSEYTGAKFSDLLARQRALPFGSKLQNHALNHRLNEEFKKYFPACEQDPIIRDSETNRYWFNESLIQVNVEGKNYNLARAIIEIIDAYINARQRSFQEFMQYCEEIIHLQSESNEAAIDFISGLFRPNVDARIFEIASFAVLKQYYADQQIFWGWSAEKLIKEPLNLYKTGRTNANDGGIDFVMRPLGRFFQVTETIDAEKYFLDIDKVQKYPITFVVKTEESPEKIVEKIEKQASERYQVKVIVKKYIDSVEEVINIPKLMLILNQVLESGHLAKIIEEIVIQSRVEFNVDSEEKMSWFQKGTNDPSQDI